MAFHKYYLPSNVPLSLGCLYKTYRGMNQENLLQFAVLAQLQRVICPQNGRDSGFACQDHTVPAIVPFELIVLFHLAVVVRLLVRLIVNFFPWFRMQRHALRIRSVNWCWRSRNWSGRRYSWASLALHQLSVKNAFFYTVDHQLF